MFKLKYAISQIKDGNMGYSFSKPKILEKNKNKFLLKNDFKPEETVCAALQMKDNFIYVSEKDYGRGMKNKEDAPKYDALITTTPALNLFIVVADCLPIIIFDEQLGILSLIHSSWDNTDKQIVKKILNEFREKGSNPKNIKVVIGPGIQKDSLIYDENIFNKIDSDWGEYIKKIDKEKYSIDNTGYTKQQLIESGVSSNNIEVIDIDTVKDERYFSHVRDYRNGMSDQGRFAMVATFSK